MEKRIELNLLLDFYGPLLTEARAQILSLYLEQDMSLQEIADAMDITRQAVHDAIGRATDQLEEYERRLGMIQRYRRVHMEMSEVIAKLGTIRPTKESQQALDEAIAALQKIDLVEI